jgi:hypothetical protein
MRNRIFTWLQNKLPQEIELTTKGKNNLQWRNLADTLLIKNTIQ